MHYFVCNIVFANPMQLTEAPPTLHQPLALEMVVVIYRPLRNPPPGPYSCPETYYQRQPLWNVCTKKFKLCNKVFLETTNSLIPESWGTFPFFTPSQGTYYSKTFIPQTILVSTHSFHSILR